jgi:hypothetical protein
VGWGYGARVITERQAYDAMYLFLVEFWKRDGGKTDLTDLLSWLGRERGGGSADPAQEEDFHRSVERIRAGLNPFTPSIWP